MSLPGGVLFDPRWQALGSDGEILPAARLYSFQSGGSFSVAQALYTDADLSVAHANPVVADSSGRFPAMYLLGTSYDLWLKDQYGVTVWTMLSVEDIGQTFLSALGNTFATGSTGVTSGYTVLSTDYYVETAAVSTNPFILNLQAASARTTQLIVKHKGTGTLRLQPAGTDTIDGLAAYYSVTAASSPTFYTKILLPLPSGTGYIVANV